MQTIQAAVFYLVSVIDWNKRLFLIRSILESTVITLPIRLQCVDVASLVATYCS
jgi:hypothetical protein